MDAYLIYSQKPEHMPLLCPVVIHKDGGVFEPAHVYPKTKLDREIDLRTHIVYGPVPLYDLAFIKFATKHNYSFGKIVDAKPYSNQQKEAMLQEWQLYVRDSEAYIAQCLPLLAERFPLYSSPALVQMAVATRDIVRDVIFVNTGGIDPAMSELCSRLFGKPSRDLTLRPSLREMSLGTLREGVGTIGAPAAPKHKGATGQLLVSST